MYERFNKLLQEKGLTAYKVAKATGVSRSTLAEWKKKEYTPKLDKLQKLANYLGVSVYYLTGEVSDYDAMRQQKIDFIHQCGIDVDFTPYDDEAIDDLYVACALKKDVIHNLPLPEIKKAPSTLISIESAEGVNLKAVLEKDNILSYGKHIINDEERATIKALIEAYLKTE